MSDIQLQRSGQTRRSGGQTLSSGIAAVGGQQFGWAETGFDLGMEACVDRSTQILENKTTGEVMGYEGTSGG